MRRLGDFFFLEAIVLASIPSTFFLVWWKIVNPSLGRQEAGFFQADGPLRMNDDLVYIGGYARSGGKDQITYEKYKGTPLWGIAPARFISLMEEAERSSALRQRLSAYTDFSRPLLRDYVAALKDLLAAQTEK